MDDGTAAERHTGVENQSDSDEKHPRNRDTGSGSAGTRRKLRCLYAIVLVVGSLFGGVMVSGTAAADTAGNNGVVYVDTDGNLEAADTAGNQYTYDTASHGVAAIGPRADIDGDGEREVPYISDDGVVYIVSDSDSSPTQLGDYSSVNPRTNYGRLAIGDWDGDGNYDVLFAPNSESDTVYRIDWDERNSAPEAIGSSGSLGGDTARAIVASTDITGDGIREIIVFDSSSGMHYVNSTTAGETVAGGSSFWGTDSNIGVGEPADLDGSGGTTPQASDYSIPIVDGSSNVGVADPDESQGNVDLESDAESATKSTTASADFTGDGVPDHVFIDTNGEIRYNGITGAPDEGSAGYVMADGSRISVDPSVGLASRISSFEERSEITSTGANAGLGLTGATTADTDSDGRVDEITVTFTGAVDDATVESGDFSLSSGSVGTVDTGETADDDTVTVAVSGLPSGDTSVTPDVTLARNSVDDTNGNTGPSGSDSTVTASDGAAPVRTGVEYRDTNSDGTVDRVDVDYSEDVSASTPESGDYTVGGTDAGSVTLDGTAAVSGSTVQVGVTGPSGDTALDIDLDYSATAGTGDSITDGTNPAGSFTDAAVSDNAPAVLIDATADSATPTEADVTFSQGVYTDTGQSGDLAADDFSFTDDSGGGVAVDAVSHTGGSNTATVTLTGEVDPSADSLGVNSNEIYDADDNAVASASETVTDETDPSFTSAPVTGGADADGFDIDLTANEDGTAAYVVVTDGAPAPSVTQVQNGENAAGSAAEDSESRGVTADTPTTFTATGLGEGTAYDVYVVIEDASGNTLRSAGVDGTTASADPTFSAGASNSVSTDEGTTGTVLDVDADDDAGTNYDTDVTYSLRSAVGDDAAFSIDAATGQLSLDSVRDFEAPADADGNNDYELTVTATDDAGNTNQQSVTVAVTDVDEAPTFTSGASASVSETAPGGTTVQDVNANVGGNADTGVGYRLTSGNNDGAYAIDSAGRITVSDASALDHETSTSRTLTVEASEGSATNTQSLTVSVTDTDESPTFTSGTSASVSETASNGATVQDVDATVGGDADAGVGYRLIGGNGDGAYAIDGTGQITLADESAVDHESSASRTLTVEASEGTVTETQSLTVSVTDADETPTFTSGTSASVSETASTGATVQDVNATVGGDADAGVSYQFTGGNGDGAYAIDGAGQITVADPSALDYESATGRALTVEATEGSQRDTQAVTVSVTDTDESPTFSSAASDSVAEDAASGTAVHDVDADVGGGADAGVSYTIADGNGAGAFAIDASTGLITVADGSQFDHERTSSFSLTVEAADGSARTTRTVSVSVTDIDESPSFAGAGSPRVSESASAGSEVVDIDADVGGATDAGVTYAISGGNDDVSGDGTDAFAIDGATGAITINDADDIDATEQRSFSLTVEASEGSQRDTQAVTVSVTDDVAPRFTGGPSTSGADTAGFDIELTGDEDGDAYYVVVPDGTTTPSVTQVQNGQDGDGEPTADSGSQPITAGTQVTLSASGLDSGTDYDVYVVTADANGNTNMATRIEQSTDDTATDGGTTSAGGTAVESPLTADSDRLDAGSVSVGQRTNASVTVTNTDDTAVAVENLTVTGTDADQFTVVDDGDLPSAIAAGGTRTVTVAFAPDTTGTQTASLELRTGSATPLTVGLDGTGTGPTVSFGTDTVAFDSVARNETATATVDLSNGGTQPIEVDEVTVDGTNASAFRVTDAPAVVPAGERATVELAYTPTDDGNDTATLSLDSNATAAETATLSGETATPTIAVDRRSLNFGNVSVGETALLNVTVRNLASAEGNLTLEGTPIVGENPESFSVVEGGAPATLAPGERHNVTVAFTPSSVGARDAQIQLFSDDDDNPQITVWLSTDETYVVVQQIADERATVNVEASNLAAGQRRVVNVSQPASRDQPATLEALDMTVGNASDFTINITHDDEPPAAAAAVHDPERNRVNVQYIQLNHSVNATATYRDTAVTYRIDRSALPDGADPMAVELSRWNGTAWNYSATGTLVEETDSHYVYRVETPGFSQFVVTGPAGATNGSGGTLDGDESGSGSGEQGTGADDLSGAGGDGSADSSASSEADSVGGGAAAQVGTATAEAGSESGQSLLVWLVTGAVVVLLVVLFALWRRRDEADEEGDADDGWQ